MGIWVIALERVTKNLDVYFFVVAIVTPFKPCLHYNACKLLHSKNGRILNGSAVFL